MKWKLLYRQIVAIPSPPSRGAWIEIYPEDCASSASFTVAPFAGGVD